MQFNETNEKITVIIIIIIHQIGHKYEVILISMDKYNQ